MYGLYDEDGILRFINSDKEACIAYAKLFEISSANFSLLNLANSKLNKDVTNLDLNQAENNN